MVEKTLTSKHNFMFWFHLFITSLAWVGPFLFHWKWMLAAYAVVVIQFAIFDKCLLNAKHQLTDNEDSTFYTYLFEQLGWKVNRPLIRKIVRVYLYPALAIFTYILQVVFNYKSLIF